MRKVKNKISVLLVLFSLTVSICSAQTDVLTLIDKTEKAMGGRKAFDATRHISWNFFGTRTLTWDKFSGDLRIDFHREKSIFLINLNSKTGKIIKNGVEMTQPDSLTKYVEAGRKMWINDMYWFLMPWKLKDQGVNAKYMGTKDTKEGKAADVLELTFNSVGVTPDNKYLIYIDKETNLVTQWSYFPNYNDAEPRITTPWQNYQTHGNILLSGDRGDRKITNIHVFKKLGKEVYQSFEVPEFINN